MALERVGSDERFLELDPGVEKAVKGGALLLDGFAFRGVCLGSSRNVGESRPLGVRHHFA